MDFVINEKKLEFGKKKYGLNSCIFKISSKNNIYIGYSGYGFEFIKNTYKTFFDNYKANKYFQFKSYYQLLEDPKSNFEIIIDNIEVATEIELRELCGIFMYEYFLKGQLINMRTWGIKKIIKCSHCNNIIKKKNFINHINYNVECIKKRAIKKREEYINYEKIYKLFLNGWNGIYNKNNKLYYKNDKKTEKIVKDLKKILINCKTRQDIINNLKKYLLKKKSQFFKYRDNYRNIRNFI